MAIIIKRDTKKSKPTKEDAALLLQLMAVWAANEENQKASNWILTDLREKNYDDFKTKYPMGSEGYKFIKRKFIFIIIAIFLI